MPRIAPLPPACNRSLIQQVCLTLIPLLAAPAVLAAYSRVGFERGIVRAFADGFRHKPATTFGTMNADVLEREQPGFRRTNFCELIAANPLRG